MWRSRIFWRLFSVYCVLLVACFAALGWLLIGRIEAHLLQETQHGLEVKALLVRDLVNRTDEPELQEQVTRVGREIDTRITLIRADGVVLADSDQQPAKMENHKDRIEVQQAQSEEVGIS